MYTRETLYSSLQAYLPVIEVLEAAIAYVQKGGRDGSVYAYSLMMASEYAYAFLAEYATPRYLFARFANDPCFAAYTNGLLGLCLRSFERDTFPANYDWEDFWNEKDQCVHEHMISLAYEGKLFPQSNESSWVDETRLGVHKVNVFFAHSELFRQLIFESLFNIRPHRSDWEFEWAAKQIESLLKQCGYFFYLIQLSGTIEEEKLKIYLRKDI